jgi:hypothetical protein
MPKFCLVLYIPFALQLRTNERHVVTLTVAKGPNRNATISTAFTPMLKPIPNRHIQRRPQPRFNKFV